MLRPRTVLFCFFLLYGGFASAQPGTQYCSITDSSFLAGIPARYYNIFFEFNKPKLIPSDSLVLDSIAAFYKTHEQFIIQIEVYTDPVPPERENFLGTSRARAIGEYLIQKGVSRDQLMILGSHRAIYSKDLIGSSKTRQVQDSLRRLNRRVEFRVKDIRPRYKKTFSLSDSAFIPGSIFRVYRLTESDLMKRTSFRPEDTRLLDSVVLFLQQHGSVVIEVGVHTDSRGKWITNDSLSLERAKQICAYITGKGIANERVVPVGYGPSQRYSSSDEFFKAKTKEEQEALYRQDRRVEFKILKS